MKVIFIFLFCFDSFSFFFSGQKRSSEEYDTTLIPNALRNYELYRCTLKYCRQISHLVALLGVFFFTDHLI